MMSTENSQTRNLSTIPSNIPPIGSPSNTVDPPSLQPTIYGVAISLVTLSTAIVVIRTISAIKQHSVLRAQDCRNLAHKIGVWFLLTLAVDFCIFAWILSCAYAILYMASYGRTQQFAGAEPTPDSARHASDFPVIYLDRGWLRVPLTTLHC